MVLKDSGDRHEAEARPLRARRRWLGYAGVVAMIIPGVAASAVALFGVFFVTYDTGMSERAVFLTFAALTLVPSVLIWMSRNRNWRAFALGLATTCIGIGFYVFVWHPFNTMSAAELATAKRQVLASGHSAVYLGDQVNGYRLNDYLLSRSQANFFYGKCYLHSHDDGGCSDWDVSVFNAWTKVTMGGDAIAGCVRQAPVAGVPTIYHHYEPAFVEEVALFTADTEVTVEFASGSNTDLEHKLQILREARLVGQSQPATALPAPRADILAYVQQNCGATP
jgi:hypothetical protein